MIFAEALLFTTTLSVFATSVGETDSSIRKSADPASVTVSTFAGIPGTSGHEDGSSSRAKFSGPRQLVLDTRPNSKYPNGSLFVVDQGVNGRVIRVIDAASGAVSTYAELGFYSHIGDIILDSRVNDGGALLITDTRMHTLYQVRQDASGKGVLTAIAGGNGDGDMDGNLEVAQLSGPSALAIDNAGKIYVFSSYFKTLKKIDVKENTMTKFAGRPSPFGEIQDPVDGVGIHARLTDNISDLAISADGSTIYFVNWDGQSLRTVSVADARVTTHIPYRPSGYQSGPFSGIALYYPAFLAANGNSNVFYTALNASPRGSAIFKADFSKQHVYLMVAGAGRGYKDGNGHEAQFDGISGIAASADGKTLYVSDQLNNVIRKVVM